MKTKKILSAILSGVMTLSLAAPAFASGNTEISVTYTAPEIAVTVPQTGSAIINPYGFDVYLDADEQHAISGKQQVVTLPTIISNQSKMDLAVYASATATIGAGSDLTFNTSPISTAATAVTAKKAYLALQMRATNLTGDSSSFITGEGESAEYDANVISAAEAWGDFNPAGKYPSILLTKAGTPNKVVSTEDSATAVNDPVTGNNIPLVILAGKPDAQPDGTEVAEGGAALLRLTGEVTEEPKTAWAATDTITTTVAFTFKPVTNRTAEDATVKNTADDSTLDTTAGSETDAKTNDVVAQVEAPAGVEIVGNVTWTLGGTAAAKFTATADTNDSSKVTVADKASDSPAAADIATVTASFLGTDGKIHTGTFSVKGAA